MNLGENACKNNLEIKGKPSEIVLFLKGMYGHTAIYNRCNKSTYYNEKRKEEKKEKYPTFNTYAKIPEAVELYGYNDFGESYYMKKWGTNLDVLSFYEKKISSSISKLEKSELDLEVIKLQFDTFKTPPVEWIRSASKSNPSLYMKLNFSQRDIITDNITLKNGEIIRGRKIR